MGPRLRVQEEGQGRARSAPTRRSAAPKKKGGTFKFKAPFFDFAEFWLNSPGTYYWQAHRISCDGDLSDCRKEGPIVKFRVAG